MRNITPQPGRWLPFAIGVASVAIGAWLIYQDLDTLLKFLKLFLGFFLLLVGLGLISANLTFIKFR